jgi:hypothetical protein
MGYSHPEQGYSYGDQGYSYGDQGYSYGDRGYSYGENYPGNYPGMYGDQMLPQSAEVRVLANPILFSTDMS